VSVSTHPPLLDNKVIYLIEQLHVSTCIMSSSGSELFKKHIEEDSI